MLRSLYSGISGLNAHQTKLDVAGNNIANVNTVGFKGSSVLFQDTLSQITKGAGTGDENTGGTNPAQIGLGVQVAGVITNFSQGTAQSTGRANDLMINGEGFFAVKNGDETLYTRAGAFDFDNQNRLVTPDGGLVQGWPAVDGVVDAGGGLTNIVLPIGAVSPAKQTTAATFAGNLPDDAADGTELVRDIDVFAPDGTKTTLSLTLTKTATGWNVGDGAATAGTLTYTNGALTSAADITVSGVAVNFAATSGFAKLNTVTLTGQNGNAAGTLDTYSIGADGTITGSFSNGKTEAIARIGIAMFGNPAGLEKAGGSTYRPSVNSGGVTLGTAGDNGFGSLDAGYLEMSNVDLSREFTELIVAQRGFQANARIITTSDEVLQELTNLKR